MPRTYSAWKPPSPSPLPTLPSSSSASLFFLLLPLFFYLHTIHSYERDYRNLECRERDQEEIERKVMKKYEEMEDDRWDELSKISFRYASPLHHNLLNNKYLIHDGCILPNINLFTEKGSDAIYVVQGPLHFIVIISRIHPVLPCSSLTGIHRIWHDPRTTFYDSHDGGNEDGSDLLLSG